MTGLEDELRETYRRNAPDPETLPAPRWDAGRAGADTARRPGWIVPAAAAACVALVVLGAGVAARGSFSAHPGPAAVTTTSTTPAPTPSETLMVTPPVVVPTPTPTAAIEQPTPTKTSGNESDDPISSSTPTSTDRVIPKGMKAVSYRGIEILVDKDLKKNAFNCMGEQEDSTYQIGPIEPYACGDGGVGSIADATLIRLLPSESDDAKELIGYATNRVTVDGARAYTSCKKCSSADIANGTFSESDGGILYFPEQKVVIDAYTTMIGGAPDAIMHTVRVL